MVLIAIIIILVIVLTIGSKKTSTTKPPGPTTGPGGENVTYKSIIKFQSNAVSDIQPGNLFLSTCGRLPKIDGLGGLLNPCSEPLNVTLRTNPSSEPTSIQWEILKSSDASSAEEILYGDTIKLINKFDDSYLMTCSEGVGTGCGTKNLVSSKSVIGFAFVFTIEGGEIGTNVKYNDNVKLKLSEFNEYVATCGSTSGCGLNIVVRPNNTPQYEELIKWKILPNN
jgi:hypothetical protein